MMLYIVKQINSVGFFSSFWGVFYVGYSPPQEATVAAINNIFSYQFCMDWIQSDFFCYSFQGDCESSSNIIYHLQQPGVMTGCLQKITIADQCNISSDSQHSRYPSISLNMQELGKFTLNILHTAQIFESHNSSY